MNGTLAAVAAATGRRDRDDVARRERARDFRGQRLSVQSIAARGSGASASFALRRVRPAFADDREPTVLEHTQLAHDSVAAAVVSGSARAEAQPVALDTQRILELERLHRRGQCVRHRNVDAARSIRVWTGALTPADRLVVRESLVSEGDVVHRALPLRGDLDR